MDKEQKEKLLQFFSDQAGKLQKEIDEEIAAVGGEHMLISRIDVLHWVGLLFQRSLVLVS